MFHPLADDRIDQPPPRVVAVDQHLARDVAVVERHDARVAFETRVGDKSRRQPLMHRAEITHRRPDIFGVGVDRDVLVDGSHGCRPSFYGVIASGAKQSICNVQNWIASSRCSSQ